MDFGYQVIVPIINLLVRMLSYSITVFGVSLTVKDMIFFTLAVSIVATFVNFIRG